MDQSEQILSETNNNINSITLSDLPRRRMAITVEFPLFLSMMALALSGAAISNIILYRTCVHSLHHDELECSIFLAPERSNATRAFEDEVQKYATFVSTVKMVIESLVPAILSLFLGVWSDTYGRKPLIVWPLWGLSFTAMFMVVYSLLDNLGPWWYILTVIPLSLTGGITVFFTGSFCYLSDITSSEERSFRMTVLEASVSAGSIVGFILSSYLLKAVGNVYLLLIVAAILVVAYVFSNIYLTESLTGALKGGLCTVFDFLLVKEMINECLKQRPNRGRAQVLLLTFANCLVIFIFYGAMGLDYYYTREKLHWSLKDFNLYAAVSTIITFAGGFFAVLLLQKYLRVSDLALVIVALLSASADYVVRTLAITTWHMYLGAGMSLFKGLSTALIRSFLTKVLPIEDIAKVFTLICAIEGLCPLLAPAIYNTLYSHTISVFPGAIYVLSTVINVACLVMLGFVQYYRWNVSTTYQPLDLET